eukprot:CAMPEP_0172686582 /NCGR_PEP_ID=MMETSP1074-20121228/21041_1 /TAXON_ID=2916 /ORGANISM="Ceratium fusus, Strain PA161109" /LENGTH=148 /DNA_ID=CAMNT_0013505907 /DNA_START=375 /DNA_END=823 /DNA_ORIENTATION=-
MPWCPSALLEAERHPGQRHRALQPRRWQQTVHHPTRSRRWVLQNKKRRALQESKRWALLYISAGLRMQVASGPCWAWLRNWPSSCATLEAAGGLGIQLVELWVEVLDRFYVAQHGPQQLQAVSVRVAQQCPCHMTRGAQQALCSCINL